MENILNSSDVQLIDMTDYGSTGMYPVTRTTTNAEIAPASASTEYHDRTDRTLAAEIMMRLSALLRKDGINIHLFWEIDGDSVSLIATDITNTKWLICSEKYLQSPGDMVTTQRGISFAIETMIMDVMVSGIVPMLQAAGIKVNLE